MQMLLSIINANRRRRRVVRERCRLTGKGNDRSVFFKPGQSTSNSCPKLGTNCDASLGVFPLGC